MFSDDARTILLTRERIATDALRPGQSQIVLLDCGKGIAAMLTTLNVSQGESKEAVGLSIDLEAVADKPYFTNSKTLSSVYYVAVVAPAVIFLLLIAMFLPTAYLMLLDMALLAPGFARHGDYANLETLVILAVLITLYFTVGILFAKLIHRRFRKEQLHPAL